MKKQKRKKTKPKAIPVGRVISELVIWHFTQDEENIRHSASELARALQMSYSLENFGPSSFGINGDDWSDD